MSSESKESINISLVQTKRGNIFFTDEKKEIIVNTGAARIKVVIRDYWDNEYASFTESVTGGSVTVRLPVDEPGYYELYVCTVNENDVKTQPVKTTLAVLTPFDFTKYTWEQSDFGMGVHLNTDYEGWERDMVREVSWMGAKLIRDDIPWRLFENPKGKYTLDYEPQRSMMVERNMAFIMASGYTNKFYDDEMTPYTADGQEGFANYICNAATEFGPAMVAVDVHNEFWGMGSRGDSPAQSKAEYYFPLLKKAYETVKKEHPNLIMLSDMTHNNEVFDGWYETILEKGAGDYMDGIFPHPYYQHFRPEIIIPERYMNFIGEMHKKYNVTGKRVWFTEQGSTVAEQDMTELIQAQYVPRAYVIGKEYGVEKAIYYDFMDDGIDEKEGEHNFGFIRNKAHKLGAYSPKASFVTYSAMTRQLTNTDYIGGEVSEEGIYLHKFLNENQKTVNVIWSLENKDINIATEQPLEVVNVVGGSRTISPENGRISLAASPDVLYVIGDVNELTCADE